jgi:choline dehydrogenase-like flavoprotein
MPTETAYDVVIVGGGMVGCALAYRLTREGLRVLILEAGVDQAQTWNGYLGYLDSYYRAVAKTPESPYPLNPDAPQPDVLDIGSAGGYFVQEGPQPFRSTYDRALGGTMLHWLGTSLRMLPEDFETRSRFGVGLDWPISYDDLAPFYESAEYEIGVSADVADQEYLGVSFSDNYLYPMRRIPPSYLDKTLAQAVDGMVVDLSGDRTELRVRSTPAGRNSMPNGDYRPVGAVDPRQPGQNLAHDLGQRCAGNSSCTPICPIQAKYNPLKTLAKADHDYLTLLPRAVASQVLIDNATGAVSGIEFKRYENPNSPKHTTQVASGALYVLAAHAAENAKLMLASGLASSSGLVGKNLMDHPTLLTWALAPEPVGGYRGPIATSGIEDARGGTFRSEHAAFRIEIGNDGWTWPMGAPASTLQELVGVENLFGSRLRGRLREVGSRQFRFGFLMDQMPDPANRVKIDPRYLDQLGNYRPVIHYDLDDYVLRGMAVAREVATQIFRRLGASDATDPERNFVGSISFRGEAFAWDGAGHLAGTHVMGTDRSNSVVDSEQRSWDHENLYLAGPGSHPTMGTANPTLTVVALAFRTADAIVRRLRKSQPASARGASAAWAR